MNIFISMSNLVADAEDLLKSLDDFNNPDVQVLRSKVESSIDEMKRGLRERLKARAQSGHDLSSTVLNPAAINPWVVAAVAALAAALLFGTIRRA